MSSKKIVGITGGIGSGKTFVCQVLETMGYPVFYSDLEAKAILTSSQHVRCEIIELLGVDSYLKNGSLNREFVAKVIFSDKKKLEKMNAIIHPAVRESFEKWVLLQDAPVLFNEAAIIFETGTSKRYDYTLLITAPSQIKINRLLKRDNVTVLQVEKRMQNQWSDKRKTNLASFIITNDGNTMLLPQINSFLEEILSE